MLEMIEKLPPYFNVYRLTLGIGTSVGIYGSLQSDPVLASMGWLLVFVSILSGGEILLRNREE